MGEHHLAPRQRKVSRRGTSAPSGHPGQATFLLMALLIGCLALPAQQAYRGKVNPSGLALGNFNRVAASPAQIEEVLRKDPGLMVELKRWVAKEATDRGQIVEDAAMTDRGIFSRLAGDLEFRSVATRLLQRYGYLLPKLNPGSNAAKEEELLHQQRVRRLLKAAEAEEEEAAPIEQPQIPSRKLAPTQPDVDLLVGQRPSDALSPEDDLGSAAIGDRPSALVAFAAFNESRVPSQLAPHDGRNANISWLPGIRGEEKEAKGTDNPLIVARPNPYADIPSLYDMYRQVSPSPPETKRFGSDIFRYGTRDSELLPMDLPVGPDYVIGPGDGLAVDLWGSGSGRLYRTVDLEGRIALPEVGPILVSGRTLGEVQQAVQQILRTQFRDVSADVSLSRLRTIRVYVVGDVEQPGAYDISSLSTPLNALFVAGGPTPRGSLRILRHYRGANLVQQVDVYDLLLHGVRSDLRRLENGDTVLVPPIGSQVTVEGAIRRPAIYELRAEKTLAEVFELAGGILPTATLQKIQVQRVEAHQKRTMLSLDIPKSGSPEAIPVQLATFAIQDQDEIRIFPIAPYNVDAIYLQGHVLRPGRYSYRAGMKLTDLVSSYADLLPEPAKYGEIIRLNPPDYKPSVESIDLAGALANPASAPALQPLDTVRIFSRYDFEDPPTVWVGGEVRSPGLFRTSGQVHLRDAIHLAGDVTPDALLENAQLFRYLANSELKIMSVNLAEALAGNPLDNILLQPRDRIVVHRNRAKVDPPSIYVTGEVAKPGRFPLTTNLHVGDLIRLAGGLKRSAYRETADLTRFSVQGPKQQIGEHHELNIGAAMAGDPNHDFPLRDGDVLTIRQRSGWNDLGASVTVHGEVEHPGTYGIQPGERLSSVLRRVGGFRPTAYPRAAVLKRARVRELQEKSRQELIRRIEQEAGVVKVSLSESAAEQAELQRTALLQRERVLEGLRRTPVTGRLVINLRSNLAEFENSPDDIEVRARDTLYIPKKPNFVVVTGQVYNANAITFAPRKNAGWYLRQAGGPATLADKKAIFVVRANGSVVTGKGQGWWGGNVLSSRIEPGDTIVVPEKPIGGRTFWKGVLAIAQIAQSASLAALVATR